jgi:hypothetical protein
LLSLSFLRSHLEPYDAADTATGAVNDACGGAGGAAKVLVLGATAVVLVAACCPVVTVTICGGV